MITVTLFLLKVAVQIQNACCSHLLILWTEHVVVEDRCFLVDSINIVPHRLANLRAFPFAFLLVEYTCTQKQDEGHDSTAPPIELACATSKPSLTQLNALIV